MLEPTSYLMETGTNLTAFSISSGSVQYPDSENEPHYHAWEAQTHTHTQVLNRSISAKLFMTKLQNLFVALDKYGYQSDRTEIQFIHC